MTNPTPPFPTAVRLERVRRELFGGSLLAFREELCHHAPLQSDVWKKADAESTKDARPWPTSDDGTYSVSYEACRNYHHDRLAPAHYYGQVSHVFGVSLEWLVLGTGEMQAGPKGMSVGEAEKYKSQTAALDVAAAVAAAHGRSRMPSPHRLREVERAVVAPLRALGDEPADFKPDALEHYVRTVSEALRFLYDTEPG